VETTEDFACYALYNLISNSGTVDPNIIYTGLIRPPPITINYGKSYNSEQILYFDTITGICIVFFSVCAVLYGKRKDLISWLGAHKSRIPLLIFSLTLIIYLIFLLFNYTPYLVNNIVSQGFPITGDEPHYILAARALQFGKADGDSIYGIVPGMFRHIRYSEGVLNNGTEFLNHPYGLPVISVIPYFLGQTLFHSGTFGALALICVLTAIISVLIYKISMVLTDGNIIASFVTSVTFAFGTDLFMWSGQFFSEVVMSFLIILFVYRTLKARSKLDWSICGIIIGLLPFFKYQAIFISAGCLIIFILLYFKVNKTTKYSILSLLITTSLFELYLYLFYGLTNYTMLGSPEGFYQGEIINVFGYNFYKLSYIVIFGLLLDRNYGILIYSPILIFSLLGIFQLLKHKGPAIYFSIFIFVFWFGAISNSADWMGWISVPGRYMIVILPLLSLPFALGLADFIKSKFYMISYVFLFLAGLIPNAIIASNRVFGYVAFISHDGDYNWYMNALDSLGFHIAWWSADFNNFWVSDNNFRIMAITITVFIIISLMLIRLSYKETHRRKQEDLSQVVDPYVLEGKGN
jgi:hypothetical protein